ncbi:nuclear transport factor 2 family protein [Aestuariivirga sp.]|uniref:nuclear transport factor 2 family protein n=1 Tax=Aestuariivirga sp. TaxID=2650926 RepID=UPI003BAD52BD
MNGIVAGRAFLAAWEEQRPDKIGGLFAEDGVFVNPLHPAPLVGRSTIEATITRGLSVLRDVNIDIETELDQGPLAAITGLFRSVRIDKDTRFDFPFAIIVEMRGALIVSLREYFDTAPLR